MRPPARRFKTTYGARKRAREIRQRNAEANRCINDTKAGDHGPATCGVRCAACDLTHRRSR